MLNDGSRTLFVGVAGESSSLRPGPGKQNKLNNNKDMNYSDTPIQQQQPPLLLIQTIPLDDTYILSYLSITNST